MAQILENDAAVKEMEGAAIAWAAHLFDVPVLALKSITDIVDGDRPPQEEFLENLQKAALALKASLPVFTQPCSNEIVPCCIFSIYDSTGMQMQSFCPAFALYIS